MAFCLCCEVNQIYQERSRTTHLGQTKGNSIHSSTLSSLSDNPLLAQTSQNKTEVPGLISACLSMIEELLNLCNSNIRDDRRVLTMSKDFPRLYRLMPSKLIIPLQESLTASLPPTSTSESTHQPFPVDAPTFYGKYIRFLSSPSA